MASIPPPLNGLRHLALVVREFEECERFYVDILGMQLLRRANADLVYLTCGNDNLSLGRRTDRGATGGCLDHFGFLVESKEVLETWFDYLRSRGVRLLDEPHDHSDGARSFHCHDPAGNVIQVLYHPVISAQRFVVTD